MVDWLSLPSQAGVLLFLKTLTGFYYQWYHHHHQYQISSEVKIVDWLLLLSKALVSLLLIDLGPLM